MRQAILIHTVALAFTNIQAQNTPKIFEENGLSGLKDASGKVILKPTYSQISDFSEELAAAIIKDKNSKTYGRKFGFIDIAGKVVIPIVYRGVRMVRGGTAEVMDKDRNVFRIDKTGKKI